MKFQRHITLIAIVLLAQTPNCKGRLCAQIFKRGSTTESYNLTIGHTGIAKGIFTRRLLGLLAPEENCRLDVGGGAILFGMEGHKPSFNVANTIGANYPGEDQLCCTCESLACEMVEMKDECAILFAEDNCSTCHIQGYRVKDGDADADLKYGNANNTGVWGHGILSSVVNWGCKLTLYEEKNYEGKWRVFYNGFDARFGIDKGWWNPVGSYKCECQRPTLRVAEWITLTTAFGTNHSSKVNVSSGIHGNQTTTSEITLNAVIKDKTQIPRYF